MRKYYGEYWFSCECFNFLLHHNLCTQTHSFLANGTYAYVCLHWIRLLRHFVHKLHLFHLILTWFCLDRNQIIKYNGETHRNDICACNTAERPIELRSPWKRINGMHLNRTIEITWQCNFAFWATLFRNIANTWMIHKNILVYTSYYSSKDSL